MCVRSNVINALLPSVACFVDSRFSAFQHAIPHATVGNNALMTSERTRIDDTYESQVTFWDQPESQNAEACMHVDTGLVLVMLCIRPFAKTSENENKVESKEI